MYLKKWTILIMLTALIAITAGCGSKGANDAANEANTGNGGGAANTTSGAGGGSKAGSGEAGQPKSWSEMPKMSIDASKTYLAHFKTTKGDFTVQLYAKEAPQTVNSFVFLANEKFYDGIKFHRIIETFMIQTGDPLGNGTGGPGYNIPDELDNGYKYEEGIVAMANTGQPNSGGSQFFICTGPDAESLNMQPNYTIFGKVSEGMDVVKKIAQTPVGIDDSGREQSKPQEEVKIETIAIEVK